MSQADKLRRGSTRALDEPAEPMTDAAVKYEEDQRSVLALAAEARKLLARGLVDERSAPEPPTLAADTSEREQHRAALEAKLSNLAEQIEAAAANKVEAEKAEVAAKEQRERDAKLLAAEKSRLESEAAALQRELSQLEAAALAEQATRTQAQSADALPAAEWRERLRQDMEPMQTTAVSTLVKLKQLMADKGPLLERISALQPGQHLHPTLWRHYSDSINLALSIRKELAAKITETQKALDAAAAFTPERFSYPVENQCHALQVDLERVSGVVIYPRAFRDPRADVRPTRQIPAVPVHVTAFDERIASYLASYRNVQKQVDAATPKAAAKEVVIILEKDPAWERRRQLKKTQALTPNPDDGRQTHATGVPTGV